MVTNYLYLHIFNKYVHEFYIHLHVKLQQNNIQKAIVPVTYTCSDHETLSSHTNVKILMGYSKNSQYLLCKSICDTSRLLTLWWAGITQRILNSCCNGEVKGFCPIEGWGLMSQYSTEILLIRNSTKILQ